MLKKINFLNQSNCAPPLNLLAKQKEVCIYLFTPMVLLLINILLTPDGILETNLINMCTASISEVFINIAWIIQRTF